MKKPPHARPAPAASICLLALLMQFAHAQEFPAKAVRIIVPLAPGGPNDLAVRPVAQKLYEFLGQPFVIGGHVDSMFISAPGAIAQIKAGKVRVLAVASARRARALPDTPTFAETGYPEVKVDTRYGLGITPLPALLPSRTTPSSAGCAPGPCRRTRSCN